MKQKTSILIGLGVLCLLDAIIPVPVIGLILIYTVMQKPPWFIQTVKEIYGAE